MTDYDQIQQFIRSDAYLITNHARQRMVERIISTYDLECAILVGEIIEEYTDDEPCPSVLILSGIRDIPLHVVIGICRDHLRIITCYYPEQKEWRDFRERR